ncbi:12649_t:CDS:2 [Acaulospora morrowiae]|uniref:12649_t:CDS:1 n=1 Tax=Acaulospora morrowiae TaxID=94023 RepID=A0A9N9B778_9GLOM|nr:12649_t:CDS:2 [Acaulospora morrowiae]
MVERLMGLGSSFFVDLSDCYSSYWAVYLFFHHVNIPLAAFRFALPCSALASPLLVAEISLLASTDRVRDEFHFAEQIRYITLW